MTTPTPKEHPILFSTPMVLANRAGRKTQTRRVVMPSVKGCGVGAYTTGIPGTSGYRVELVNCQEDGDPWDDIPMRYQPGDRLWVRETWALVPRTAYAASHDNGEPISHELSPDGDSWAVYRAGWVRSAPGSWRPSIHMPRWASRNTYEIVAVRPQRLQDITPEDITAEGLACLSKDGGRTWKWGLPDRDGQPGTDDHGWPWDQWRVDPVMAYLKLWDQINAARGYGSDKKPWVWAITYRDITEQARAETAFVGRGRLWRGGDAT